MIATAALSLARLDPASLADPHHQLSRMNFNTAVTRLVVDVRAKVLLGMNL
jgi:hypothetical protein